jgi:hypothetical protein
MAMAMNASSASSPVFVATIGELRHPLYVPSTASLSDLERPSAESLCGDKTWKSKSGDSDSTCCGDNAATRPRAGSSCNARACDDKASTCGSGGPSQDAGDGGDEDGS